MLLSENETVDLPISATGDAWLKMPPFFTPQNEGRWHWHIRLMTPLKSTSSIWWKIISGSSPRLIRLWSKSTKKKWKGKVSSTTHYRVKYHPSHVSKSISIKNHIHIMREEPWIPHFMWINCAAINVLWPILSLLHDCWPVHTKSSQLNQSLKHTKTAVHDHHSPRVVNWLCQPQEKTYCLSMSWKHFGCKCVVVDNPCLSQAQWHTWFHLPHNKLSDIHSPLYVASLAQSNIHPGQVHIFVHTDIDSSKHNTQLGLKHAAECLLSKSINQITYRVEGILECGWGLCCELWVLEHCLKTLPWHVSI